MKLNLGCGSDVREGYINVDFRQTHPAVVIADLSKFPWPFADASAEEILMLDALEHFPYRMTNAILLECFRVLSDEGRLLVQVPDGTHLSMALAQEGDYLCNRCGFSLHDQERSSCEQCGQSKDDVSMAAMKRLYGGQDYPGNFHQVCFTKRSLLLQARGCGLALLEFLDEEHQHANWNFMASFSKKDLWGSV